jgi:Cu/Ag efflux protein CusF
MKALYALVLGMLTILLGITGCRGTESKGPAEKQYPVQGKVIAINVDKPSIKLEHEDIPGLMQGMTMDFAVPNAKLLEGLKAGDKVHGRLKVESGKYVITELQKHGG